MPATRTFLFSDLREYTAFVEHHGDAAATTLIADYRRIVRAEIARHDGAEVKTEGDSFYIVFTGASAAVSAGQALLREADRYSGEHPARPLRIGVGIHSGEPQPHEGQYVGSAVIVAARLAQQAAAGELLVTEVVRALLGKVAPPMEEKSGLVLKGIADAPRIFAVTRQPTANASRPPVVPHGAIAEAPAPQSAQILCPDVIGRDAELALLAALFADVRAGTGRTVLVGGEAGLGKSALLRRFSEHVRASNAQLLIGDCSEVEARRPFGPFIDALERAGVRLPTELAQGGPGAQLADEAERYRVHAGFTRELAALAVSGPVVVAIEDLHWGDEATLELVPYLARKLRDSAVLILATYRTDELHRLHPLTHILAELGRGRLAAEIRLRPLTVEQTGLVIRAALGIKRTSPEFREAIHDRCGGNPFFTEEILRALVDSGDITYRDGAWERLKDVADLALPSTVRDAVQQRLRTLSADELRVIQVAAVVGQRFDFDLLQRVAGIGERQVMTALRAAIDGQLIHEERDGGDAYAFRHALTRESVLADLMQRERRLLHREIAQAIEAVVGADAATRAEELAYHFDQARETAKALEYHELAAREATKVFAFSRSARHLERAVELAADDDPSLAELQLRLAEAANCTSDFPRAVRAAQAARALFEARGDARMTGETLVRMAQYRWMLGDTQASEELAAAAVQVLEPLGDSPELARAYTGLGRHAISDVRDVEAATWGERATEVARRTRDQRTLVGALLIAGPARAFHGDRDGLDLIREAIDLCLRHEFVHDAQWGYQLLLVSMLYADTSDGEFDRVFAERSAHATRYGHRPVTLITMLCTRAFGWGDWDEALAFAAELPDETIWSAAPQLIAAFITAARYGPERGLPLLDAPRRRLVAAGDVQWIAIAALWTAATLLLTGEAGRAIDEAEAIAELVRRDSHHSTPFVAIIAIAAAREHGDAAALERWLGRAETESPRTFKAVGARRAFARGERLADAGDIAGALAQFADAQRLATRFASFVPTIVQLRRAELLSQRGAAGDRDAAARVLAEEIAPFWRRANATWYLGRLTEWAAARDIPFNLDRPVTLRQGETRPE